MKTKTIVSFLVCSLFLVGSYAQTEKGTLLLGGNAGTNLTFGGATAFYIGVAPDIGYFVNDDIAIGARVPLSLNKAEDYRNIGYGLVPFFRYYVQEMDDMLVFITANIGFQGNSTKVGNNSNSATSILGGAGMGVAYMLTKNIGIEGIFGYSFTKQKDVDLQSRLGIDAGFQIYYKL